jgi:hypothetical protein
MAIFTVPVELEVGSRQTMSGSAIKSDGPIALTFMAERSWSAYQSNVSEDSRVLDFALRELRFMRNPANGPPRSRSLISIVPEFVLPQIRASRKGWNRRETSFSKFFSENQMRL